GGMAEERALAMVTCTAPVNIAVIKYWGKRDNDLILPINSSLSVTLHQDQLKTTTTAAASRDFTEDRLWLNGEEADAGHPRLQACLREGECPHPSHRPRAGGCVTHPDTPTPGSCPLAVRRLARKRRGDNAEDARKGEEMKKRRERGERGGTGRRGGRPSVPPQVSGEKKAVGSTAGMQTSVDTSPLLKHRAEVVVPERLSLMIRHIRERDFEGFGQLTMRDSNQFHATCLDTFPPIFYLNDVSRRIIALAHRYNTHHRCTKVAYTFDAGPNAVIFTLADTVAEFVEVVRRSFPPAANGDQFVRGLPVGSASLPEELLAAVMMEPVPGAVRYILHTQPGPGPQLLDDPSQHLLGADGLPCRHA
ncbi:MVD1 decarboxylase, partial [Syrrhaptes paradoxus]|nr:MVD1 decarboxylase [Syrrhaptes paradoxus]